MKRLKNFFAVIVLFTGIIVLSACEGADYVVLETPWPEFDTACLPLAVAGSGGAWGSFAFDGDGNLLFPVPDVDEIRSLARDSCTVTTVATGVAGSASFLGIIYHNGWIYAGHDDGNIYRIDPATGVGTVLVNVGATVNGFGIAPAGFGAYGGQLIAVTNFGDIYAINLSVPAPVPVQFADTGHVISSMVFGSDGTLYVTDSDNDKILTVTAGGTVADFATGLSSPDGLAINNAAGLLYVANYGDDTLKSVTIPGGVVTNMGSYDFDSGWYPSPIIYDEASSILLMGTGESSLTIRYLDII